MRGPASLLLGILHDVLTKSSFLGGAGGQDGLPDIHTSSWRVVLGVVPRRGLTADMSAEYA